MIDLKLISDVLLRLRTAQKAKIFAHVIAPGLVLSIAAPGIWSGTFVLDAMRPLAVSELRTVISDGGNTINKAGVVIIVEPTESEYHLPLSSKPQHIWSSLNQDVARINRERISVDASGFRSKAPFLGVNAPTTFVLEGVPGKNLQVPGGFEKFDDLVTQSRRSAALVSGILLACMFAFGMSSAAALPFVKSNKRTAG